MRKKNKDEGIMLPEFILQSYSNQNSKVQAWKTNDKPVEQNKDPRNKPTHVYQLIFDTKNTQ